MPTTALPQLQGPNMGCIFTGFGFIACTSGTASRLLPIAMQSSQQLGELPQNTACMQVLDWELQRQLVPDMKDLVPLPGIFDPDYIAANQDTRADNIIKGSRSEQVQQVRQHIRQFKEEKQVDKVSLLLTPPLSSGPHMCRDVLMA